MSPSRRKYAWAKGSTGFSIRLSPASLTFGNMTTYRSYTAALVSLPLLLCSFAACGGAEEAADANLTSVGLTSSARLTPTVPTTPAEPRLGEDAEKMADTLQAAISALKGRIRMTEDNDENHRFGRPGQYDQVTFLGDSRLDLQRRQSLPQPRHGVRRAA